jgi:hypothetical protein
MKKEKYFYDKNYRVTNDGTLLSPKGVLTTRLYKGYFGKRIRVDGKLLDLRVHRLQAYQKYGDDMYNDGIVVRHLNGVSTDNSWDNIAIGTHSENQMDIPKHIRISRALHATSFMKKHEHDAIRKYYYENGKSYKKTKEKFNISSSGTLHFILNKKYYKQPK